MHRRWTVGELSTMLEIAAPTLRTWERRYGVGPTFRTAGGHRRYTVVDADRVATMAKLIDSGIPAREAAARVKRMTPHEIAVAMGAGPDAVRVSDVDRGISDILTGALRFDGAKIQRAVETAIDRFGVGAAWDEVISPATAWVRAQWDDAQLGLAGERLVNLRVLTAVRGFSHLHRPEGPSRVVLASIEHVQHHISLVVLSAALAEKGIASTELGARLPLDALEAFVQTTEPEALVVWSSQEVDPDDLGRVQALGSKRRVVLGGTGWPAEANPDPLAAHIVEWLQAELGDDLS